MFSVFRYSITCYRFFINLFVFAVSFCLYRIIYNFNYYLSYMANPAAVPFFDTKRFFTMIFYHVPFLLFRQFHFLRLVQKTAVFSVTIHFLWMFFSTHEIAKKPLFMRFFAVPGIRSKNFQKKVFKNVLTPYPYGAIL